MLGEKPELRGVRDRVLQMRAMPGFASLDEDALALMAEDAKMRFFDQGDHLLRAGRTVDRVFLVTSGLVHVQRGDRPLRDVREGEVGLLSVLAGDAVGIDALAREPTSALELPAESVHRNMHESFAITRNTMRQLARQLLEKRGRLPIPPEVGHDVDVGMWRTRALTMVEKLLLLRATPFGQMANLDAAAEMVRAMTEVRYEPGEVLWKVGEPSAYWLRIEYGRVRCTAEEGRSVDVGAGFVLGIIDGWADQPRSYDALADTPVVVQRMDLAAQLAVLETHAQVAAQTTRFLARSVLGD